MSLKRFFFRNGWDDERARELEAHLAIETDDNIARGMTPEDARLAAQRKLGNRTLVREEIYHMNTISFLDSAWRDLRYGARLLRLNPSFAIVAILSLALGVDANTAIFQLLDAVRLRTLPVRNPQELVEVRIGETSGGRTGSSVSRRPALTNPLWEQIRDHQQAFSSTFAYSNVGFNLTTGGEARYAQGIWASGEYFNTLGVSGLVGRTLTSNDDRRGCQTPPAVISYGFWQREYAGSLSVIGRSLMLDGHAYDIVGVTPASFFGMEVGRTFDVVVPLCAEPLSRGARSGLDKPDTWFVAVFGRLNPGWSIERATSHLASLSPAMFKTTLPTRYGAEDAKHYLNFKLAAFPAGTGVSSLRRNYESPLWLLMATAGLVLLIACANLANLMLARATAREREFAVRLALGASRGRLIRQLLVESLTLALLGTALGALLAGALSRALVSFLATGQRSLFLDLSVDWRVLSFTALAAGSTCILFGLAPALHAVRIAPGTAVKAAGRGLTASRERFGFRRALVVSQVALSVVLLAGALLFVRSLRNLLAVDAGFRADGLVVASLTLPQADYPVERRHAVRRDLLERLRAAPGLDSAAEASIVPVSGSGWNNTIHIEGEAGKSGESFFNSVS